MEENKNVTEILKEIYDSLTDEQKEKAKKCKTMDEFVKLASEEGIELPDEALDAVAGGVSFGEEEKRCSECGRRLPNNSSSSICAICRKSASESSRDEGHLPKFFRDPR